MTAHSFDVDNVKYSESVKKVFMLHNDGAKTTFDFTFYCKIENSGLKPLLFFFNLENRHAMMVQTGVPKYASAFTPVEIAKYTCSIMGFSVVDDLPLLSVKWWQNQEYLISVIAEDFKLKYAAYLLDNIVNS